MTMMPQPALHYGSTGHNYPLVLKETAGIPRVGTCYILYITSDCVDIGLTSPQLEGIKLIVLNKFNSLTELYK